MGEAVVDEEGVEGAGEGVETEVAVVEGAVGAGAGG